MTFDNVFSTETRLELVGIARPVYWLWMPWLPCEYKKQKDRWGSPIAPPMPKSVLSGGRENQLLNE